MRDPLNPSRAGARWAKPARVCGASGFVGSHVARLLVERGRVGERAVFLSNGFRRLDSGKARRELGWNPRPIAESVRDAVAWYAQREGLA